MPIPRAAARSPICVLVCFLSIALLGGCAVGPNYRRPEVEAPAAYRADGNPGTASLADLAWWDVYRDPRLKDLIAAALAGGFDARIAAARVEQSQALAAQVHGQLFPGVGYGALATAWRCGAACDQPVNRSHVSRLT